ncbi:hypothetical protein CYMTET_46616 [Cymbomonas tetramitiformis]|uniref:RRM domain-containing protein n=1 Tax=Cymbomonas tetramitiformis TaxID=36881 RepID=A0AAE0BXM0_9CHLO|nr:hypothetical protein CYMTET_46616 [Cymbomonas tetramitiformis]
MFQQQQLLAQQWLMSQQQQAAAAAPAAAMNKKQRELYVGNLTVGLVTPLMLKELFNGALAPLVPDSATNPPCINVGLDSTMKFAFVEFRTEELATMGLHLDKVELCGRNINVGRPRGYIDPNTPGYVAGASDLPGPAGMMAGGMVGGMAGMAGMAGAAVNPALMAAANPLLATLTSAAPASTCVYLGNLIKCNELVEASEREEVAEEVKEECSKRGEVLSICIPEPPPDSVAKEESGRVYVKFREQAGAIAAQRALNGRTFGGNKVVASFIPENDYDMADAGAWLDPPPAPAPAEGVIKMRGLPFTAGKQDIVLFFQGFGLEEQGVNIVYGRDGRPSGECYCVFEGEGADIRGALTKHRQTMGTRYVELFPSSKQEMDQARATGVMMM